MTRMTDEKNIAKIIGILLLLPILQFHRVSIAMVVIFLYIICNVAKKGLHLKQNIMVTCMLALAVFTVLLSVTNNIGSGWKLTAVFNFGLFVFALLFYEYCAADICTNDLSSFVEGIKIGCLLNITWCYVQYMLYSAVKIDINDLIFHRALGLVETASAFRDGVTYCVTGFGWHPGQLVPVLLISFLLFDSVLIKLLLIGICLLAHNSTCLIACMLCILFDFHSFIKVHDSQKYNAIKVIEYLFLLGVVFTALIFESSFIGASTSSIRSLFERLSNILSKNSNIDTSSYLHFRYYTYLPELIRKSNIFQILLGCGYECSGLPFSKYLGQYTTLNDWIVESDYINLLVGRGIIWTSIYYFWLIQIFNKGRKISAKNILFTAVVLIAGVFYNNQFWWFFLFEIILSQSIQSDLDLWSCNENTFNIFYRTSL